ncbi:MAG: Cys-tRNA(Pro) deacylase [Clostridia bacterium]|jgi:Cys-tRNA(Pro)/Cys-tRNA(Cys) deacylase|nr:Cys-tRNA(Pro) deacylase [Clostridia bacterium]MBQ4244587.1 Cys-tRNA(Pro) deacylase [Clostridia bacterium]
MVKTNVMRLLESAKIEYELLEYEVDESDLSGDTAAAKMGIPPEQMFKTLVFRGEKNGTGVCCIPVHEELDLKKAAKQFGEKKIEMLHVKDLLPVTGYIRGGCSPIGMKKKFPTAIDETALLFDKIYVSAGARGETVKLSPQDLADYVKADFADLITV